LQTFLILLRLETGKKVNWVKLCDEIWSDIIKAKAGYKSEYSGKLGKQAGGDEILNAHHIVGKPNHRLRYDFDNGICLWYMHHRANYQELASITHQTYPIF